MTLTRLTKLLVLTALAMPLAPASTFAAPETNTGVSGKIGLIEKQIGQSQTRRKVLSDELQALEQEEEQISSRLIDLASRIQAREAMITAGEKRIAMLDQQHRQLRANLDERRETLTELLAGLQRLERNRPPPLATRPGDAVAAIRGAMLFGAVVPALNAQTSALARTLAELDTVRARQMAEQTELREHVSRLDKSHKEIAGLHARKAELIKSTGTNLQDEARRAKQLAGKAKSLKQLMSALVRQRQLKKSAKTAQAAEQKRRERLAGRSFTAARGQVSYPVQGQLLRRFGDADGLGGHSKGIYIATRSHGQVTAPVSGEVDFAGEFRSYGKLLILDVGQGYHVLLAGLDKITAETGQIVRAGEPVGQMGNTAARGTLIGEHLEDERPILYVEFRVNGGAVDSSSWWIGNRKEARR